MAKDERVFGGRVGVDGWMDGWGTGQSEEGEKVVGERHESVKCSG